MRQHLFMLVLASAVTGYAQDLTLNDLEYFERQGVNVLVFSNSFNGGFNDEKNSGIEVIHHADFSAIPGNVAPGLLFRKPDHFENYDDWPFLWGQNEGTIAGNTQYVIFGSSLKNIVAPK